MRFDLGPLNEHGERIVMVDGEMFDETGTQWGWCHELSDGQWACIAERMRVVRATAIEAARAMFVGHEVVDADR